jgi:quercetin dioxygenase-like cupin family protein
MLSYFHKKGFRPMKYSLRNVLAAGVLLPPALVLTPVLLLMPIAGQAHGTSGLVMIPGDAAITWSPAPSSLPKGMTISILSGNPDNPGPFTLRLRMPPNTVIAPHTHSTAENVTVLSGTIVHETGEKLVRAKGMSFGAGGFVFLPGQMPHSLWTTGEPGEIQVSGTGPFGLHYVNAADDPRNAK